MEPVQLVVFRPVGARGALAERARFALSCALQLAGVPYTLLTLTVPDPEEGARVVVDSGALDLELEDEVDVEAAVAAVLGYAIARAAERGAGEALAPARAGEAELGVVA